MHVWEQKGYIYMFLQLIATCIRAIRSRVYWIAPSMFCLDRLSLKLKLALPKIV